VGHREDAPRVEGLRHRVVIGDELLEGAQQPVRGRGSARVALGLGFGLGLGLGFGLGPQQPLTEARLTRVRSRTRPVCGAQPVCGGGGLPVWGGAAC
jgi:hypothetical protein